MPIVKVDLEISDEVLAEAEAMRLTMPMPEFLSYAVTFGIADIRDGYQAQQRDYLARTLDERIGAYQRGLAAPNKRLQVQPVVVPFTPDEPK